METPKQYSFKDVNGALTTDEVPRPVIESEFKPIAISISTDDVQALFAANTTPFMYQQLILAKLRDNGCTAVEGKAILKLAHGALTKVKDNPLQPETVFCYVWLPAEYAAAIAQGQAGMPC